MASKPGLGEAEREVLRVLWDRGPSTVREVNAELEARGRTLAYTTVATMLQRLAAKGCAASDSSVVPHVYRASVERDELLGQRLKATADELCDGHAAPLVLALVQGNRFTPEELARFQAILDEARAETKAGDPPKGARKGRDS